jgi:hypothetical protein
MLEQLHYICAAAHISHVMKITSLAQPLPEVNFSAGALAIANGAFSATALTPPRCSRKTAPRSLFAPDAKALHRSDLKNAQLGEGQLRLRRL